MTGSRSQPTRDARGRFATHALAEASLPSSLGDEAVSGGDLVAASTEAAGALSAYRREPTLASTVALRDSAERLLSAVDHSAEIDSDAARAADWLGAHMQAVERHHASGAAAVHSGFRGGGTLVLDRPDIDDGVIASHVGTLIASLGR